ncbi:hypothetical protein G3T18_00185 [Oscillatoria salina IIICB1]|nr:hypothetical protein [Oscillatoria salina IIICB1]
MYINEFKAELIRAKERIKQNSFLWAYPIALALQKSPYFLAIQWLIECLQIYLYEFKSPRISELNKYIQQARDLSNILTFLQCNEIAQEIWYLSGRDEIQTAIARLWWSISAFNNGKEHGGIMEVVAAIELILPDTSNCLLLDRYLQVAVKIYEEYESQN